MFHFKLYENGSLYGMTYSFPERGDGIPMHTHEPVQEHNVMVLRGSVAVYGPGHAWSRVGRAGDILDDLMLPHEIAALEDDTIIVGMFIHGKPEGECLPEHLKRGTITKPLLEPA